MNYIYIAENLAELTLNTQAIVCEVSPQSTWCPPKPFEFPKSLPSIAANNSTFSGYVER